MVDRNLPPDLQDRSEPADLNGDYYNVFINDLDVDTEYKLQFAWILEDGTVSEDWSPVFKVTTDDENTPDTPQFLTNHLIGGNGFIKVIWNGKNASGQDITNFKQVNIWIKGGTFGSTYVNSGQFFTEAGTITIPVLIDTYYVKLQTETKLGNLSEFSTERSVIAKQIAPKDPTSVSATWSGLDLLIQFTHDPSDSQNAFLKEYNIYLSDGSDTHTFTLYPQDGQTQYIFKLDERQNRTWFGVASSFTGSVWAADNAYPPNISNKIPFTSGQRVTALTPPTITLTQGVNGYSVAYTDQTTDAARSSFNAIEIFETLIDPAGSPVWESKGTSSANPVLISTGLSIAKRWVRALVYDKMGLYPKDLSGNPVYTNVASVTPLSVGDGDQEPPNCPTFTSGTTTWNTIPLTIITEDETTRGFRVIYQKTTATLPANIVWDNESAFDVFDLNDFVGTPKTSETSTTLRNLEPNSKYGIKVYPYDANNSFNITCSTAIIATTAASTVPTPSNLTFEVIPYGVTARWDEPTNSDTLIDKYIVTISAVGFTSRTANTYSNNATFLQLKASKTYTVTVKTLDVYGVESSSISGTFSLNADGVVTDGVKPPVVSNLTVQPAFKSLVLRWDSVTNKDYATYDIHMATTNNFTINDATTKVATVDGNFYIINKLPNGNSLDLDTTYYIAIVSKDADGQTNTGLLYGSGAPSKVDNGDIAANAIRANVIEAGAISASQIDASALLANNKVVVGSKVSVITSATVSGGNIVYTATAHPFAVNDLINISGMYTSANVAATAFTNPWPATGKQITAITTNTFTIANTTSATGTAYFGRATKVKTGAITIDSSSDTSKLFSGTGAFKGTDTPFYLDSTGQFSIYDKLRYSSSDGTDSNKLIINGEINATGGVFESYVHIQNSGLTTDKMKLGRNAGGDNLSGIYINENNYWYTTGNFKIGSSNAGVSWNSSTSILEVTGVVKSNGGYFKGNTYIDSLATLYAGTVKSGTTIFEVDDTKARLIFNKDGIKAYPNDPVTPAGTKADPTTQVLSAPDSNGYTFITKAAQIGGWEIDSNSISKSSNGSIKLDSTNVFITVSNSDANKYTTLSKPFTASGNDYVFWAGSASNASAHVPSAPFRVTTAGKVFATDAEIQGKVLASDGGFGTITNGAVTNGWQISGNIIQSVGTSAGGSKVILDGATGEIRGGSVITSKLKTADSGRRITINDTAHTVIFSSGVANETGTASISANVYSENFASLNINGPQVTSNGIAKQPAISLYTYPGATLAVNTSRITLNADEVLVATQYFYTSIPNKLINAPTITYSGLDTKQMNQGRAFHSGSATLATVSNDAPTATAGDIYFSTQA